jgi:hypothetical protein
VWSTGCAAWYNKQNGSAEGNTVTALYPGSALHYKGKHASRSCSPFLRVAGGDILIWSAEYIKTIRGEHFDIRYNTSNPFRFLGNGELEMERNGGDTAYYLQ